MSERERELMPFEVDVSTREQRERRERAEPKRIEQDSEIDWRSYGRRSIPNRWKAR